MKISEGHCQHRPRGESLGVYNGGRGRDRTDAEVDDVQDAERDGCVEVEDGKSLADGEWWMQYTLDCLCFSKPIYTGSVGSTVRDLPFSFPSIYLFARSGKERFPGASGAIVIRPLGRWETKTRR